MSTAPSKLGSPLLEVEGLSVTFTGPAGPVQAVKDATFTVQRGERLGVVGESGSGKSTMALSLTRLVERLGGRIDPASRISFDGRDVVRLKNRSLRGIRGRDIGMVFQDPMTSLNPRHRIGDQIVEAIRTHNRSLPRAEARRRALELMERMGIARASERLAAYPYEFSGGMRQRAMIAMALSGNPSLLIADEPTTALDVTVQAQIMDLLSELVTERALSVLLITHDLGIVAGFADRMLVMYGGRIVEAGSTREVFARPAHPYSAGLIASIPRIDAGRTRRLRAISGRPPNLAKLPPGCAFHPRCAFNDNGACVQTVPPLEELGGARHLSACHHPQQAKRIQAHPEAAAPATRRSPAEVLLDVRGLRRTFTLPGGTRRRRQELVAVDDVSFTVRRGETLGLVGESGSGKSTVARCVLRLIEPTRGEVTFDGADVLALDRRGLRAIRRDVQMIFQDPFASLDPRFRVGDLIAEPMHIHGLWGQEGYDHRRVLELLEVVGLSADAGLRYPAAFSGGERQRIGIARALAIRPKLLVCDEPVSALDVSIRAQIINLLQDLQDEFGLSYLFIAHDLALVRHVCDRIAVMHDGKIVELADRDTLYRAPQHPCSRALMAAVPLPEPRRAGRRLPAEAV